MADGTMTTSDRGRRRRRRLTAAALVTAIGLFAGTASAATQSYGVDTQETSSADVVLNSTVVLACNLLSAGK